MKPPRSREQFLQDMNEKYQEVIKAKYGGVWIDDAGCLPLFQDESGEWRLIKEIERKRRVIAGEEPETFKYFHLAQRGDREERSYPLDIETALEWDLMGNKPANAGPKNDRWLVYFTWRPEGVQDHWLFRDIVVGAGPSPK